MKEIQQLINKVHNSDNIDDQCDNIAKVLNKYFQKSVIPNDTYLNSSKYKRSIKYIKVAGAIMSVIVISRFVVNYKNIVVIAQEIITTIKQTTNNQEIPLESTYEPNQETILESAYEPNQETTLESTHEPVTNIATNWVRFKLEYPDGYPDINDEKYETLYNSIFYIDKDSLNEIIKSEITIWLHSCTDNISLDNAVTPSGKSTEYYSNIEANFINETEVLMSSDLLDEVISGRKELLELYPNGILAWLLANHMQTYALNYLYQTNHSKSILYFYMESIYYTQKSLEFEMDNQNKFRRINYLQSRYKDIAECENIDTDTRLAASKIYIAIQEALNELQSQS